MEPAQVKRRLTCILAADAESAAAEIGRFSGDLLIWQLRNGLQQR